MMKDLTYWLRKTPQPVAILADDKRIDVPKNGRAWRDLTQTLKALDPSKLTALDGSGNVLRSVVLESDEEKPTVSPEMSDVQLFARLLAEAYDKATGKMQPIVDSAMAFVERGGARLAKAEAEVERLRSHIHKLNMQIADLSTAPAPAGDESILGTIVGGAMQAMAAGATQGQGANGGAPAPTPITKVGAKKS